MRADRPPTRPIVRAIRLVLRFRFMSVVPPEGPPCPAARCSRLVDRAVFSSGKAAIGPPDAPGGKAVPSCLDHHEPVHNICCAICHIMLHLAQETLHLRLGHNLRACFEASSRKIQPCCSANTMLLRRNTTGRLTNRGCGDFVAQSNNKGARDEAAGIHSFVWTGGGTQDELERALDRSAECAIASSSSPTCAPRSSTSTGWEKRRARSTSRSPSPWACRSRPTCRAPDAAW